MKTYRIKNVTEVLWMYENVQLECVLHSTYCEILKFWNSHCNDAWKFLKPLHFALSSYTACHPAKSPTCSVYGKAHLVAFKSCHKNLWKTYTKLELFGWTRSAKSKQIIGDSCLLNHKELVRGWFALPTA